MKFYYYSFNEYHKLSDKIKQKFIFLATSYTVPKYYDGLEFKPFVPSKELFFDGCKDFEHSNYQQRYKDQIYSLNRENILIQLEQIAKDKDVVFLVWEGENKDSERDIFIPWLTNTTINDIKYFSFSNKTSIIEKESNLLFNI